MVTKRPKGSRQEPQHEQSSDQAPPGAGLRIFRAAPRPRETTIAQVRMGDTFRVGEDDDPCMRTNEGWVRLSTGEHQRVTERACVLIDCELQMLGDRPA